MSLGGSFDVFVQGFEEGALRVVALRGRERLSRPYTMDVTVAARDVDETRLAAEAIGRAARLVVHGAAGPRVIRGVVSRARSAGRHLHDRGAWEIRIVPRLALLRHRRNSRIFQDRTVIEIVNAVLGEAMIPVRWEAEQAYVPRSYCVQYEETDLEFVERLLAEVGAFYRFEHPEEDVTADAPEEVVIGDRARYMPIEGDPRLVYRSAPVGAALAQEERHVTLFSRTHAAAPLAYERRDHDFQRPLTPLRAAAKVDAGGGRLASVKAEVYEHHSEFAEAESEQRLEETALSQLRRKADVARGESQCVRLACGRRFTLDEHEMSSHDGDYVVTEIEHRGASPETTKEARPTYENRFRAIPASGVLRPARRPRQMRQVMETAVVTGPEGQEIHTDAYGRVKVQFRWDREGKNDERSSCWIRVAQAWSGGGWGFQFVPRIGMEVLVSFLGGDPDRPVVVGSVPDATHPVPNPLPENRTKSGIKTQSTPGGGGYNEILFDDAKGGELVAIRAERNLTETVMSDHQQTIGRDQSVTIAGSRDVVVKGAESLRVDGAQTWTVTGPSSMSVGGGAVSSVAGSRTTAIAGDDSSRVGGGHTVIAAGFSHLLVGQGTKEGGHGLVLVNGSYRIGASADVQITSVTGITLRCGDSAITLSPGEVKIESPKVTLVAKEELYAKGKEHELAIGDHLEMRGKDIRLFGEEGRLLLDKDARVEGAQIKLGSSKEKPEDKKMDGEEEKGTIVFRVKPHFEVQPGDKLIAVIAMPSGETVEREVDASMTVTLEGKKGDRYTLVDLRKGELPFGKRGG